jgi:hypothetical protein
MSLNVSLSPVKVGTMPQEAKKESPQKGSDIKTAVVGIAALAVLACGAVAVYLRGRVDDASEVCETYFDATCEKAVTSIPRIPLSPLDLTKQNGCPIIEFKKLTGLFNASAPALTLVGSMYKLVESHYGISCDNYLPHKQGFKGSTTYIDGISHKDMERPIMWSIDSTNTPYIALKLSTKWAGSENEEELGATSVFQRYSHDPDRLVSGGSPNFPWANGHIAGQEGQGFLEKFSSFLKGEPVSNTFQDTEICLKNDFKVLSGVVQKKCGSRKSWTDVSAAEILTLIQNKKQQESPKKEAL